MNALSHRPRVLYFSRGRGRGHAVPDMAICEQLRRVSDADVQLASYATGAVTLAEAGYPVTDLHLPEEAPFLDVLFSATHVIAAAQPDFVVSHEEFAVLPAAKLFGCRAAFIVDFFPSGGIARDSLRFADEVVFIERRGLFPEPPPLSGRIRYTGPVVRSMCVTAQDRGACRQELGLPEASTVVSVIPGAWATEARAPIVEMVADAFAALAGADKRLLWIAGRDHEAIGRRFAHRKDVIVLRQHSPIEKVMVASDVVVTKANRGTTIDLASLGIPSVSLSYGLNPIDEAIIPHIRTNTGLDARGIDAAFLAQSLEQVLAETARLEGRPRNPDPRYARGGAAAAASALSDVFRRWVDEALPTATPRA